MPRKQGKRRERIGYARPSPARQFALYGFRGIADLRDRGIQFLGGDAELLAPIADLVVFAETDPAAVWLAGSCCDRLP
jgi:hypothetical protein